MINEVSEKKIKDNVTRGKCDNYYLKKRGWKRMKMEAKFEKLTKSDGDG